MVTGLKKKKGNEREDRISIPNYITSLLHIFSVSIIPMLFGFYVFCLFIQYQNNVDILFVDGTKITIKLLNSIFVFK